MATLNRNMMPTEVRDQMGLFADQGSLEAPAVGAEAVPIPINSVT